MKRKSGRVYAEVVGKASKQVMKLALPFGVPSEDRIRVFPKDVEMAAILYLAEEDRKKDAGRILKKPDEKLAFITQACYPIWLIPWNGGTLLFDGLGVTTHTVSYDTQPDVEAFLSDIQASAQTGEAYSAALSRNANYFQAFAGREQETIEGLITDPDFIQDFWVYLLEAEEAKTPLVNIAVVSPFIDASDISVSVKALAGLKAKIEDDVRALETSMKLLTVVTRRRTRVLRTEIRAIRRKSDQEIKKVKPRVNKKMRQIQKKYDGAITKFSKRSDKRLRRLQKDRRKLQKSKKAPSITKRKIKAIDNKIARLKAAKKKKLAQEQAARDTRIEEAATILGDLETSCDTRIGTKQNEKALLKKMTSSIIDQLDELVTAKRAALHAFYKISMDTYGIGRPRKDDWALVYLPLYLVRYETESTKRYMVYPPSVVGSISILTKVKEALGVDRMKSFLQPYSKSITAVLKQLVPLMQSNPVLEQELSDAGIRTSILGVTELRMSVSRGLHELRGEKWLSETERETLSNLLYTYSL